MVVARRWLSARIPLPLSMMSRASSSGNLDRQARGTGVTNGVGDGFGDDCHDDVVGQIVANDAHRATETQRGGAVAAVGQVAHRVLYPLPKVAYAPGRRL